MSGNYVINIGRQLGSGGKEIGEKLAARLGIDFYDKELINLASEESRVMSSVVWRQKNPVCSSGVVPTIFYGNIPVVQMSLSRLLKKIVSHGCVRCIVLMRKLRKR